MNEKMKENNCCIDFLCNNEYNGGKCLYFTKSKNKRCKYEDCQKICNLSVAQVNRMMLHAKHIGLDLTAKGFSNENTKIN